MSKTSHKKRLCIIIPAYNEATAIGDVITEVQKCFHNSYFTTEVLVVDDGSKDNTHAIAKKHGALVVRHILNTGAGGATATGLSYAQQRHFDIAATMDADGQHMASDVKKGVELLVSSDIDLLIGSRLIDSTGMSRVKVLGNRGLSFITRILFGIDSTDSQSGLRIFSRDALENLRWKTSGYEFCSEMLWRAKQQHMIIDEYPIRAIYTDYSKKKGQNNWNALNIVKSLIKRRITELLG